MAEAVNSGTGTPKELRWRGILEDWPRSGLSKREYCERHGLKESTFHFWRRELAHRDKLHQGRPFGFPQGRQGKSLSRRNSVGKAKPLRWLPVHVAANGGPPGCLSLGDGRQASPIEIVLRSGHTIRLARGFDAAELGQVVSVLEGRS